MDVGSEGMKMRLKFFGDSAIYNIFSLQNVSQYSDLIKRIERKVLLFGCAKRLRHAFNRILVAVDVHDRNARNLPNLAF